MGHLGYRGLRERSANACSGSASARERWPQGACSELTPAFALMHYPPKGCEGDEYPCRSVTREGGRQSQRAMARGASPLTGQRAGARELTEWKPPVRSMGNTTPEPPVEIERCAPALRESSSVSRAGSTRRDREQESDAAALHRSKVVPRKAGHTRSESPCAFRPYAYVAAYANGVHVRMIGPRAFFVRHEAGMATGTRRTVT
jgi:hypothetical protein